MEPYPGSGIRIEIAKNHRGTFAQTVAILRRICYHSFNTMIRADAGSIIPFKE